MFNQILFGLNFPASKIIVSQIDPMLWSNMRFLLAGLGMLFLCLVFRRKAPPLTLNYFKQLIPLSLLGMALGQGLFLYGLRSTTSVNSAILITTIPILTLIVVVVRKEELLNYNKIIGILIAFLGVILMRNIDQFSLSNANFIGDLFVLIGAFCFALYLSLGKKFFRTYDNMWSTTWMFIVSALTMAIFNIGKVGELTDIQLNVDIVMSGFYSVFFATLLTYLINNWALMKVSSGIVAIFIYLQPIVAGLVGYFYLGEEITSRMLYCSLFILVGVLLTLKSRKPKPTDYPGEI
tara:strand:- start:59 stop:937 length:879 start_codon:yes stop_codon:yes gene_type:complete